MAKKYNRRVTEDFVARTIDYSRICVSGRGDNFYAVKNQGKWEKGYPDFNDLMDNFSEESNLSKIQRFSSEARSSLSNIVVISRKKPTKQNRTLKTPSHPYKIKISKN